MNTHQPKTRVLPLLFLIIISTFMAEVLSGSTPFSRINQLAAQFFFYGSGAILIRGIARRLGLGWTSIILLGFAFGLFTEGLTLQSIFNPHFLGLDITLGRAFGINWVWAMSLTGLHAFWSITGAILFTETLFPAQRLEPWIGKTGLYIWGIVLLLTGTALHFLFIKLGHFNAPAFYFALCVVLIGILAFVAVKRPPVPVYIRPEPGSENISFAVIAVITFAAGVLWFVGIGTIFTFKGIPAWMPLVGGPLLLLGYFSLLRNWRMMKITTNKDRLGLAAGILLADLFLGYTGTTGNKLDHYAQVAMIVFILLWLAFLYRKLTIYGSGQKSGSESLRSDVGA
ncbi:hypothetical protein [Puia sp.]|jgi:hypothetical protein|uniref:hypothetical protein n=1 Tax=Puia sp. TaxID=2045100 RepID=UPI002F419364